MADSLSTAVESAVQQSFADHSASSAPEPAKTESTAPAGETPAPTAETGKVTAPSAPSSTDPATKPPSGKEAKSKSPTPNQPAAATPAASPESQAVPLDRHEASVRNARTKEREAVYGELRNYGIDVADRNALENIKAFAANPAKYVADWIRHYNIPAEQVYGTTVKQPAKAPSASSGRPQPDLRAEDGTHAYSAQAVDAIIEQVLAHVDESVSQRLSPFEEQRRANEAEAIRSKINQEAADEIAEARTWENFEELRPRILELYSQDGRRTLASAYAIALKEYGPKAKQKIREQLLQEIKSTPAVPSDVAPMAQTRAGRKEKRGFDVENAVSEAFAKHSAR